MFNSIALTVLILIASLALVVFAADWLVDGASSVARRLGISEFVIGLTIVGFGTSMPELVVSMTGALEGNGAISAGNVIGSNIFNTLLILGITAILMPIGITRTNLHRDVPVNLLTAVLFAACAGIGMLNRITGVIFLLIFAAYLFHCFKTDSAEAEAPGKTLSVPVSILLILAGLGGLILGGKIFVDSAVDIAHRLGVSDKFIAVTILAGGTSMPELVTCIVAAAKKRGQLALGNILGSNIFNILLILGLSSLVAPFEISAISSVDVIALTVSAAFIWISAGTFRKNTIDRIEGALFLLAFIIYYVYLFIKL